MHSEGISQGANNTIYIVSRELHSSISHYGGVAWAKAIEAANLGKGLFNDIKASVSSFVYGTLITNVVGK